MALFIRKPSVNTKPGATPETAMFIYGKLLEGKDSTFLFTKHNIPDKWTSFVWKEAKRIENEVISKVSGTWVLTPAVPATYDEDGNELTPEVPAVYYEPTTPDALKESISSNWLTVDTVVQDVKDWYQGTPESPLTWAQFANLLNS